MLHAIVHRPDTLMTEHDDCDLAAREAAIRLRDRLLATERWYSGEYVLARLGKAADGLSKEDVDRLRRDRRLFGVRYRGQYLYPAFQFDPESGELLPAMSRVLAVVPVSDENWNVAFWMFQQTGRLAGARPADRLGADPDAVTLAAQKDFYGDPDEW